MRLISHRGNIDGKIIDSENQPDYILKAINLGYEVEVDVWYVNNNWFLGHDSPDYEIEFEWLDKNSKFLWVHCKNIAAIEELKRIENDNNKKDINYFFHNTDDLTLTSQGYIWKYPGVDHINCSINVMPEINNESIQNCLGVCSDFISRYKNNNS